MNPVDGMSMKMTVTAYALLARWHNAIARHGVE